jgi:ribose transport system ATP-binding protein
MSFILEARNLKKSFDGVVALSDANFTLNQGEICGLVGANGSGKTTFARIISGLIHPDSGQLYLYGSQISLKSHLEAERLEISMVHQNLSLIPEMTVWENINLGREFTTPLGILKKEAALNRAKEALQELQVNISFYDKVSQLAPSDKQLLEIVKALSRHPKILILDEPTASLGFRQVDILFEKLNQLKNNGVSVIFISHRIWEITKICDRLVAFRNGKTVGEVDFHQQPRDERLIIPLITGKKENEKNIHEKRSYRSFDTHQLVLEVDNLSKKEKLHNVTFKIREGEIVGLGGLNGQGQEEILLILSGYLKKTSGKIKMNNQEVFLKNSGQAIKRGIFLVPGDRQKEGLFLNHNVFTNLIYPQVALKKQKFLLPLKELHQAVTTTIQTISLIPPDPRKLVSHLSGGNQQKVVIGKWLSLSPKILLLNDPTKGVDVETRRNLYKIIADLSNQGVSVLLYASDNEELIANCDRVLIVFEGQIVEEICGEGICEENLIACSLRVQ